MIETASLELLKQALQRLDSGFDELPAFEQDINSDAISQVLFDVADRLQDDHPYAHPLYAGQMLKPPHPVARLAYTMAMYINPNNHALDGGRASSIMEKEAVAEIASMFNWSEYLGHLTGGGTMANLEALWIAGLLNPGKKILASDQAHFTHSRITEVLGLEFEAVATDARARMDLAVLEQCLKQGDVGTVVATLGNTGTGAVDPLPEIVELRKSYGFTLHVDAAYGGYYTLVDELADETRAAFDCLPQADSIVVDPHKHGLQPYGCGCVLFKDPSVGKFYKHDSPYTYFSSDELHLGEISLECSRAGASAVALWATQQLLPMSRNGEFARDLTKCRRAALKMFSSLREDPRFLTALSPELDIIIWAPKALKATDISSLSRQQYDKAATHNLHLALIELPKKLLAPYWHEVIFDEETVTCLRSCLLKPEHFDWLEQIWSILDDIAG